MAAEGFQPCGEIWVIGGDHAPFTRGDGLYWVEGKGRHGGMPAITDPLPLIAENCFRPQGMRGILHEDGPGLGGERLQAIKFCHIPPQVNRQDRTQLSGPNLV